MSSLTARKQAHLRKQISRILCCTLLTFFCAGKYAFSFQPSPWRRLIFASKPLARRIARIKLSDPLPPALLDTISDEEGDGGAFGSSFLYDGTFQGLGDDGLLNYLPKTGHILPPKTKRLLRRITSEYIYGVDNRPQIELSDVISVIEEEYLALSSPVSMKLGNRTLHQNGDEWEQAVINVLSLAVLHQLPKEITVRLFGSSTNSGDNRFVEIKEEFEEVGWEQVSFPKGLGIRMKPELTSRNSEAITYGDPFSPPSRIPWRNRSNRRAAEAAQRGIVNAAETRPPKQNIMSKEEFLVEIENEMRASQLPSGIQADKPRQSTSQFSMENTPLPSFPERYRAWTGLKRTMMNSSNLLSNNKSWKKVSTAMDSQYTKIKEAGRAGLMAYSFINFILYTVGIAWQWRRVATEMPDAGTTLVSLTLKRLGRAFARVYVGASLFKLVRIGASLFLAPAAGRVLQYTQRKLGVSENTAFAILIALLFKTFLGTLAAVILGDSALRMTAPPPSPPSAVIQEAASSVIGVKVSQFITV